jgi:hypothetical protein
LGPYRHPLYSEWLDVCWYCTVEVHVVVPFEKVQLSSFALALRASDCAGATIAADVAGAVGVSQAARKIEARTMAVSREIMGFSAVKSLDLVMR